MGKRDAVRRGAIEGSVASLMGDAHALPRAIVRNDAVSGLTRICALLEGLVILGGQPFALVEVKDAVIAEKGNLLLFVRLFVLLLDEPLRAQRPRDAEITGSVAIF